MKRNPTAKLMALGRNSVNVAACPSVVRELLRITPVTHHRSDIA